MFDDFLGEMKRAGATSIHGCWTALLASLPISLKWVLLLLGYFVVVSCKGLFKDCLKCERGEREVKQEMETEGVI